MALDFNNPSFWRHTLNAITSARSGHKDKCAEIIDELLRDLDRHPDLNNLMHQQVISKIREVYGLDINGAQFASVTEDVNLEQYKKPAVPGVSLVTCTMNRWSNLINAIPTWLFHEQIREIIIVDWSSKKPVFSNLPEEYRNDSRLKVIRVNGQPRWVLSWAFNLGFRAASCDRLLKVDADIILDRYFFQKNRLGYKSYIAGSWKEAEPGQEYINGFFYTDRDALLSVSGFNEYITTYGWDDDDLYNRLTLSGMKRKSVDVETIWHQPHDDDTRVGLQLGQQMNALDEIKSDPQYMIRKNYYISKMMPTWDSGNRWVKFREIASASRYIEIEQEGTPPSYVPNYIYADAEHRSLIDILTWRFGDDISTSNKEVLLQTLTRMPLTRLTADDLRKDDLAQAPDVKITPSLIRTRRRRLIIDVQHGLGNRLRAMASAAVIAEKHDMDLLVVWVPDNHCDCTISDLFDYHGDTNSKPFSPFSEGAIIWNYMEAEPTSDKGARIDLDNVGDVYIRSAYVLNADGSDREAENQFLRSLSVQRDIMDLVESIGSQPGLGAHVRMEAGTGLDHHSYDSPENWTKESHETLQYWRDRSHYSRFIARIENLLDSDKDGQFFIAADRPEAYKAFRSHFPGKMRHLQREYYDRSKEQLKFALADAIILSRCDRILGSYWSSFTELALRLSEGETKIEMSGIDF